MGGRRVCDEHKADIQARLTEAGVPWREAMTVAGLRRREEAAGYDPRKMTREEVGGLTIVMLREILVLQDAPGLSRRSRRADYINAVFSLNRKAYEAEAATVASVPLDVFRIVASYLPTAAAKMRFAAAVGDRERIAEHGADVHPTELTVIEAEEAVTASFTAGDGKAGLASGLSARIAAAAAAQYTWLMDSDALGIRIVCRPEYNEMDNAYTIYVLQYPDLYLKVRRTSPFARRPAAMIEWGTTFYINAITTEIFSAMLEKFAIGMDWIRRYTETGLKPHKWGGVFRSKQMTHSSILSLNREMPEIWERWVRDRIRCYNRHKM